MNNFYLYILKCSDESYYIGHTDNIELRISEHNEKKHAGYTSRRLPVKLVFVQEFSTRDEAISAECKIKKWTRRKKEALIKSNWSLISELSKKNLIYEFVWFDTSYYAKAS